MRIRPALVVVALATWWSTACSGSSPTGTSPPTTTVGLPSAIASHTVATVTASAAVSARPLDDAPPMASLAAEGGDPVAGQLGTYTWRDGGSDGPWLQGTPIKVGRGEPLSVSVAPAIDIAGWQARSVPAGSDGPAGASPLGEGRGSPAFDAPAAAGAWTIEVHVVFDGDVGSASYFWRLDVNG
jgi:hypothetical protein